MVKTTTAYQRTEWPSDEECAENARTMRREARALIAEFEARFGMTSAIMRARLDRGEIEETAEVGKWLMELYTLELLDSAG